MRSDIDGLTMLGNNSFVAGVTAMNLSTATTVRHASIVGNLVPSVAFCFVPADLVHTSIVGNTGNGAWGDGACHVDHSIVAHNGGCGLSRVPMVAHTDVYGGPSGEDDLFDGELDGLPDGWELRTGLDPDVDDALEDLDGDGLSNLDEFLLGTRPDVPDTDADQVPDADDPAPLDRTTY